MISIAGYSLVFNLFTVSSKGSVTELNQTVFQKFVLIEAWINLFRDLLFSSIGFLMTAVLFVIVALFLFYLIFQYRNCLDFLHRILVGIAENVNKYNDILAKESGLKLLGVMFSFLIMLKPLTDISTGFQKQAESQAKSQDVVSKAFEDMNEDDKKEILINNPGLLIGKPFAGSGLAGNAPTPKGESPKHEQSGVELGAESIEKQLAAIKEALDGRLDLDKEELATQLMKVNTALKNKPDTSDLEGSIGEALDGTSANPKLKTNFAQIIEKSISKALDGNLPDPKQKKNVKTIIQEELGYKQAAPQPYNATTFEDILANSINKTYKTDPFKTAVQEEIQRNVPRAIETAINQKAQDAVLGFDSITRKKFISATKSVISPIPYGTITPNCALDPDTGLFTGLVEPKPSWLDRVFHPHITGMNDALCKVKK